MFAKGAAAAFVFLVVFSIGLAVYNVFFHPLAKFPGPRFAVVLQIWLWSRENKGGIIEYITEKHRIHGTSWLLFIEGKLI
ncbi:hypothetical protein diail_8657 [Diaporthe ilicicola]|nr:hypothetical protein diail_8657 [Diaporthe ilicicola]